MALTTSPLRLGARVCFEDRWQGTVTSIDIAEDWEVLNVTVSSGLLFFSNSVKLPLSSAASWDDDSLIFNMSSLAAFAREIPPVAAPSRPVSGDTPVAHHGARITGFMVRPDRRATEVLIARGFSIHRIPTSEVTFDGKALTLGRMFDNIPEYVPDAELQQRVRDAISEDTELVADDKLGVKTHVDSGVLVLGGNVRVAPTKERVEAIVRAVPGVAALRNEIVDDITLETNIGLALDRAGVSREAEVFARANLGRVVLYGSAPSQRAAEDITREVVRVAGVREAKNLLSVGGTAVPA